MPIFLQNEPGQVDLFEHPPAPVEVTGEQIELLQGFASKEKVVWDLWDDYFYRYDRHRRCTQEAYQLLEMGLVDKPVMGQGRFCKVTPAGYAVLLAAEQVVA